MIFCCLLIFFRINFSKNSYNNTIRVSNILDPDQARHYVGPDLDPNCLQRLSADLVYTNQLFHQVRYDEPGMVHCSYPGVTG